MVESLNYSESLRRKAFFPDECFAYLVDMSNYEVLFQRKKLQLSCAKDEKSLHLFQQLLSRFSIKFETVYDPTYSMLDKLF